MVSPLLPALPVPRHALPAQLHALVHAAQEGAFASLALHGEALALCLPSIMRVLWSASAGLCNHSHSSSVLPQAQPQAAGSSGCSSMTGSLPGINAAAALRPGVCDSQAAAQVVQVLQALFKHASAVQVSQAILPWMAASLELDAEAHPLAWRQASHSTQVCMADGQYLNGSHVYGQSGSAPLPAVGPLMLQLLQPSLLQAVLAACELQPFVQLLLPRLLSILMCRASIDLSQFQQLQDPLDRSTANVVLPGHSGPTPSAQPSGLTRALAVLDVADLAANALLAVVAKLPLPVTIDCLVQPLLAVLDASQAVPRLLVAICNQLGGAFAGRHIAPALLQMMVVPAPAKPKAASSSKTCPAAAGGATSQNVQTANGKTGMAPGDASGNATLAQRIYTATAVLSAISELLPRELLPRVALHGLSPAPSPAGGYTTPAGSTSIQGTLPSSSSNGNSSSSMEAGTDRSTWQGHSALAAGTAAAECAALVSVLLQPQRYEVVPGSLSSLAQVGVR